MFAVVFQLRIQSSREVVDPQEAFSKKKPRQNPTSYAKSELIVTMQE
jgi:hypothetical protein